MPFINVTPPSRPRKTSRNMPHFRGLPAELTSNPAGWRRCRERNHGVKIAHAPLLLRSGLGFEGHATRRVASQPSASRFGFERTSPRHQATAGPRGPPAHAGTRPARALAVADHVLPQHIDLARDPAFLGRRARRRGGRRAASAGRRGCAVQATRDARWSSQCVKSPRARCAIASYFSRFLSRIPSQGAMWEKVIFEGW